MLISLIQAASPHVEIPLLSVTHGQHDSRFTVTFPACAGTKLILLGDRGTLSEQLAKKMKAGLMRVETATCLSQVQH